ncbi:hypothetical protein ACFVXR_28050 [Bacillus thuringiensis]|uniref:hypothetical protein n=1 Tax=Bacillus TaxID=1386 RepID=UPI00077A3C19|nr:MULTISPECIES: hypothetical protein [Bacillus]KAA6470385.1 hypothetical protein DX931_28500 [Bacillus cereus]KAB2372760.1 hypothetical protein F8510_24600 [Bacillus sp. RM2(2019)]KXY56754.1 hypothetical protein AT261_10180 [Bacillus cereus]PES12342.1 hypothetical protein CN494_19160 [Bacillus cereus]PEX16941.1 hypothetical protein CN452_24825 [Bacillus cereus]
MFKKLVVGALAAGIALTGGIGAASASTENGSNTPSSVKQLAGCYPKENGKYIKEVRQNHQYFDNTKTEPACGGTVVWYLKKIEFTNANGGTYIGHYEGWLK